MQEFSSSQREATSLPRVDLRNPALSSARSPPLGDAVAGGSPLLGPLRGLGAGDGRGVAVRGGADGDARALR
eukprot:scaffold107523_cov19-Tisochrysis_lutea.AAC.1